MPVAQISTSLMEIQPTASLTQLVLGAAEDCLLPETLDAPPGAEWHKERGVYVLREEAELEEASAAQRRRRPHPAGGPRVGLGGPARSCDASLSRTIGKTTCQWMLPSHAPLTNSARGM